MSKKNCWILSDNLIGHEKQSISLAEKLNTDYKIIKTKKLNLIERNLLIFFNLKKTKFLKAPFPKLIISCGKNTAYYSKLIKKNTNHALKHYEKIKNKNKKPGKPSEYLLVRHEPTASITALLVKFFFYKNLKIYTVFSG